MKLNATEKNALEAVKYLLWQAKVNVSTIGLEEELVMHPDFPSLASISDALHDWEVPSLATRISPEQLREIPMPALAYLDMRGGIMAPVKSVRENSVEWLDTQHGWQKENIETFSRKWNGTILLIEAKETSGEKDFQSNNRKEKMAVIRKILLPTISILCLVGFFIIRKEAIMDTSIGYQIFLITKVIGTLLTGLLLWQSIDTYNPFLRALCQVGNKSNCNSILQSKAANITNWLSWSEVGFIYFAGGSLALLLSLSVDSQSNVYYILSIIAFLALPFTFYSVWYQSVVARDMCTLCLLVQAMLWIEAFVAFRFFPYSAPSVNDMTFLLILFISGSIPVVSWWLIKPYFTNASQVFDVRRELQKIKFDEQFVQATFENQWPIPPVFEGMKTANMGNTKGSTVLTVVTNPLCAPCAILHSEIEQFLKYESDIRVRFIFLGSPKAQQVSERFLSVSVDKQSATMTSWYSNINQSLDSWLKANPSYENAPDLSGELHLHARWCHLANITYTPTIFLNDRILPRAYQLKDIPRLEQIIQRASISTDAFN